MPEYLFYSEDSPVLLNYVNLRKSTIINYNLQQPTRINFFLARLSYLRVHKQNENGKDRNFKSGSWWSAFYRYWTMINGRNSTDKEILADSAETKAHEPVPFDEIRGRSRLCSPTVMIFSVCTLFIDVGSMSLCVIFVFLCEKF